MTLYTLSLWLLQPCFDAPEELFIAGLLWESDPMPEAEARAKFARHTYEEVMAEIEHEGEPVNLSLDLPDSDGIGICQEVRTLRPTSY